jgi:hypothetical protein
MPASPEPLKGDALVKEVCRRIRVARSYWDAHNNAACRGEREKALALYNTLTKAEKEKDSPTIAHLAALSQRKILWRAPHAPDGQRHRENPQALIASEQEIAIAPPLTAILQTATADEYLQRTSTDCVIPEGDRDFSSGCG